ncbi:hypothetical protein HanRHA438_Chr05g0219591 [Helianthus annuus]|nr:hypothetical protein HanRHA438_Chr05g0219591 [Helianthus annuus]
MLILIIVFILIHMRFMLILIFIRFMLIRILILLVRFMLILILTCTFVLKLIFMLILPFIIHTFIPVRERNPRDSSTWVPNILKHGLAYILYTYTYTLLFLNYVHPDSYSTSISYADHATIKIIAGAHGIIVMGV